ncbi:acyltransferase [Serinicoccus kebangsaanensis]|uniref:acyltransferase n=1 Tax=Serinicoccus kebangsaanensis TaxID=2602069 RepID=UPI00124CD6A4|nr:acyltransferase [Serinicoccus kebangsaanensis]
MQGTAWISWLRCLAVFGVVLIHTVGATATAGAEGRTGAVDGWVARALDLPLLWVVPVFVMLSGALTLDPARFAGTGSFLRRRVWRLVPALVVWHLVYLAYLALTRPASWSGPGDALARALTGQVAPHLYFFWIVLGLSLLTPLLVPWLARTGRREWVLAGLVAWAVPVLSLWPLGPGGEPVGVTHSAWTWWLPYLGAYLMGFGLRGVVLPRRWTLVAALLTVALAALLTWQWKNPAAPDWLQAWAGAHYYSPSVAALCLCVYLLAQSLIRPGGALAVLTGDRVMAVVDPLGRATLGIFALHFLVLLIGTDTGLLGPPVAPWPILLGRFLVVGAVTTGVVLLLRRVPVVRTVL